jgi:hypothetical protein
VELLGRCWKIVDETTLIVAPASRNRAAAVLSVQTDLVATAKDLCESA